MAIATTTALLIAASAGSAASGIYGANKAASAARRAGDVEAQSSSEALQFERENEERRRLEYDQEQEMLRKAWEAEQDRQIELDTREDARYRSDDARRTRDENMARTSWNAKSPYRAAGSSAVRELAALAGLTVNEGAPMEMVAGGDVPSYPTDADLAAKVQASRPPAEPKSTTMPAPDPSLPPPDADGLIPVTMSAEAYRKLAKPRPREPITPRGRVPLAAMIQSPLARAGKAV
jgi:hypothetical protein